MRALFFVCFFPFILAAQIPPGYYNSAQNLTGNPLKIALHNIIKNHTQLSYNALWNAYKKTDIKPNGKVWDMYSDVPAGTPPYQYTFVTDQCGNYSTEGDCYNREHSWPQSWFNSVNGPVSDLFHIYPTDGKVNGVRNNYPYGNVTNPTWTSMNGSKLGPCSDIGYNQTVFEPINEYKGDFARSYFYMSTRYYSEDNSWASSDATNKSDLLPWQANVLLQWHHQDPVSTKEIARNDSIYYKYQNNRNPFIDHPQWADSIWHYTNLTFVYEQSKIDLFAIYPNPATNKFQLINKTGTKKEVYFKVYDITGVLVEEQFIEVNESISINCEMWAPGVYFINLNSGNYTGNCKLVKY